MYTHVCMYVCACTYVCMYASMYVCIYAWIYDQGGAPFKIKTEEKKTDEEHTDQCIHTPPTRRKNKNMREPSYKHVQEAKSERKKKNKQMC